MYRNQDVRLNIRIPRYLQDFYKSKADVMAIPYTNLISLVLYNYYVDHTDSYVNTKLRDVLQVLESQSEHLSKTEIIDQIKYVLEQPIDHTDYDQSII